ncbi:MAG: ATPase [Bacteroidales bacterium]|nr:ATPase [Candidatus Cryptobacteroides fimicaballi]
MIIIVESGATKTDWCAVAADGSVIPVRTAGMNIATMPIEAIKAIINEAAPQLNPNGEKVTELHYYAAGLIIPEGEKIPPVAKNLDASLKEYFPDAEMEYASDLLDAARAVCGHKPGIAAIMGTGSNSCLYDGKNIVKNVRSAGFILGDEGGGACLGKMFMADFLKGLVPEPVSSEFARDFQVDYFTVVQKVYKSDAPSKYLGEFAPWIMARYDSCDYVRELVDRNFRNFIERALSQYDIRKYPVGVVGGFGYAHQEKLRKVAAEYGIRFSEIIATPIEGLIKYHTSNEND